MYNVELLLNCSHIKIVKMKSPFDSPEKGELVFCPKCQEKKPVFMKGQYWLDKKEEENENENNN